MAKTQVKRPDTPLAATPDTTVIRKPYKVVPSEMPGVYGGFSPPTEDSTRLKRAFNLTTLEKSREKRNSERLKEGKKPIPTPTKNQGMSDTGKSFSEAPLKRNK